ncbi:Transcriptional repressor tup1 protein [Rutstroemia sp. NJR-2017a WRK4]|nr:Transcriptional repressor tup1 protein [Rutstroemia sp. NJR-2017a WRK4]
MILGSLSASRKSMGHQDICVDINAKEESLGLVRLKNEINMKHITILNGEMSCDLSLRGFPTKAALQHHTTVHHGKATDKPAPILRRKIGMHLKKAALEKEAALAKEAALERQAALERHAALERQAAQAAAKKEDSEIAGHRKKSGLEWSASFNPKFDIDLLHTLKHSTAVSCVVFSDDEKYLATSSNLVAQIFDVATGQSICTLQDESIDSIDGHYIKSVCFSLDGRYLATGSEDNLIRIWNITSRSIKNVLAGHEGSISSLVFAYDKRTIISGSEDRTIQFWDIESNSNTLVLPIASGITSIAISLDGQYVACGSFDNSVRIWEVPTGYLVGQLKGRDCHTNSVYSVDFSPNSKYLVSGSLDKTIKIWEISPLLDPYNFEFAGDSSYRSTFKGHEDGILTTTFTPDGKWVLSGSKNKAVRLWDIQTGKSELVLRGHENSVTCIAASSSKGYFATASGDMTAKIWRYHD